MSMTMSSILYLLETETETETFTINFYYKLKQNYYIKIHYKLLLITIIRTQFYIHYKLLRFATANATANSQLL